MAEQKLFDFGKRIKYEFRDLSLLEQAMRHRSFINENMFAKKDSNERLEFLGDAVLELITSEFLFKRHKDMLEGDLTKHRAGLVCETSLAVCAREIGLGEFLRLGKGEDNNGGRQRDSLLSDGIEALIGAIYIDGGFGYAKQFVEEFILKDEERKQIFYDSKTILQEIVQEVKDRMIQYKLVREEGPDHEKVFVSQVYINDRCYGEGFGTSKKNAEQNAAHQAILKLKKEKA